MDVVQNAFEERPVHVTRFMHVEASLLQGVGEIGSSQRQILKHADDAMVEHQIIKGFAC